MLTQCQYEVVDVANGKLAMDEIKRGDKNYDLVLLDLYMPEMDGFEVLSLMKEDESLSHIQIIVMSANESNDIISNCLKMGALNYLVKPIKKNQCVSLPQFVKTQQIKRKDIAPEEKWQVKYDKLHELGRGAAGVVQLIKKKDTKEKFALKTMNLAKLNDKDKKMAESEAEFLRVITGPTIIKFYESFIENQNIYIVMEYAEGGSLADLIRHHAVK